MVQFHYNNLSKSSGIYVIFNSYNWRIYVGSTVEFKNRWSSGHVGSLLRNKHSNKFLQADFNKCKGELGHDDFLEFHVLEHLPGSSREQRLEVEEKWINVHFDKGEQCYNLCDRAISREGSKSKNPEETKKKRVAASLEMWKNEDFRLQQSKIHSIRTKEQWENPEFRAAKIAGMKGKKVGIKRSKEISEAISERMKEASYAFKPKTYKLLNPDGQLVVVQGLAKFCNENSELKLNRVCMSRLITGKVKSYKGWKLFKPCETSRI